MIRSMKRTKFPLDFPKGLAKKLEMDAVHISRIKHGRVRPSPKLALKIYRAALARVRLTDLLQVDEDFLETCRIIVAEDKESES